MSDETRTYKSVCHTGVAMSTAAVIEHEAIQDALPACLVPWIENPYRLVSWLEIVTFDGGRLATAMMNLADLSASFRWGMGSEARLKQLSEASIGHLTDATSKAVAYCEDAGFLIAIIPLRRLLQLIETDIDMDMHGVAHLMSDAAQRLRDEAAATLFLRVQRDRVHLYEHPLQHWREIIARFPDTTLDVEEAAKCLALERYAACVFHGLQILEFGVIELGHFLGVQDHKPGWSATMQEMKRITTTPYSKLTEPERGKLSFVNQMNATISAINEAWRNKVSHAHGKLTVMTSDFSPYVAEEILIAVRAFMRRLASDLP